MLSNAPSHIWIVTGDEAQKRVCETSLSGQLTRYFPSWEALISELIYTSQEDHPDHCLLHDFSTEHTMLWFPLLKDCLARKSEVILFGAARDLMSLKKYYEWGIYDYLGLPLRESRLRIRFEFIQKLTA